MHRAARESELRRRSLSIQHNAARELELHRRRAREEEKKSEEVIVAVNDHDMNEATIVAVNEADSVNSVSVPVNDDSDETKCEEKDDLYSKTYNKNKNSHISLQKTCKFSSYVCTF